MQWDSLLVYEMEFYWKDSILAFGLFLGPTLSIFSSEALSQQPCVAVHTTPTHAVYTVYGTLHYPPLGFKCVVH